MTKAVFYVFAHNYSLKKAGKDKIVPESFSARKRVTTIRSV